MRIISNDAPRAGERRQTERTSRAVLSFAAVGSYGREWCMRLTSRVLVLSLVAAPVFAQAPFPYQDFAPELASRIAAALVPPEPIDLSIAGNDLRFASELTRLLAARGIRATTEKAGTSGLAVRVGCLENLREHACVAEIRKGEIRQVVAVTRPLKAGDPAGREPIVSLEVRPVFAQREPILDVMMAADKILVLGPDRITLHSGDQQGRAESRILTTSRVWPRDLRGQLYAKAAGFDVFLPGVTCRGTLAPFNVVCADEGEPWPIGIENTGMVAGRNYFTTLEGLPFYSAAPLGAGAGGRWLLVDARGGLLFLDDRRQVIARADAADDVVGLDGGCGPDTYVVTSARGTDAEPREQLRLFRVVAGRLAALPSAVSVPGTVTALWAAPGDRAATAVVHDVGAGRYEAFQIALSCTR